MSTILDRGFNAAVLHIANRLFPCGFDVRDKAPETFDALKAQVADGGRMVVWSGGSDQTIFGDPEVNYAFRAWHDWCHLAGNHDFTLEGERAASRMQMVHLIELYGIDARVARWCHIINAEVVGQAEHLRDTGEFPKDQMAFVRSYLGEHTAAAL